MREVCIDCPVVSVACPPRPAAHPLTAHCSLPITGATILETRGQEGTSLQLRSRVSPTTSTCRGRRPPLCPGRCGLSREGLDHGPPRRAGWRERILPAPGGHCPATPFQRQRTGGGWSRQTYFLDAPPDLYSPPPRWSPPPRPRTHPLFITVAGRPLSSRPVPRTGLTLSFSCFTTVCGSPPPPEGSLKPQSV